MFRMASTLFQPKNFYSRTEPSEITLRISCVQIIGGILAPRMPMPYCQIFKLIKGHKEPKLRLESSYQTNWKNY
jgi:hypothetical protein